MRLSVIIPAHNEEALIAQAIRSVPAEFEVIVVDDDSTDATAAVARQAGAIVVPSGKRNIGATRNIGARASTGKYLLFLDADTVVNADALAETLHALDHGAVGGGACLTWSEPVGFFGQFAITFWNLLSRVVRAPAGGYFFMTREAFDRTGGFDESYYVSEELWLGRKLRKLGRVRIISSRVTTSARKLKTHSRREIMTISLRLLMTPFRTAKDRSELDLWYTRR